MSERKADCTVKQTYKAKGPKFKVNLDITKDADDIRGMITIRKIEDHYSAIMSNSLCIVPEHIPDLIKDLEWAYDRWMEGAS